MGQSSMDNPETLAALGTRQRTIRHTKLKTQHRKLKDEQHVLHQNLGVNPGACEG